MWQIHDPLTFNFQSFTPIRKCSRKLFQPPHPKKLAGKGSKPKNFENQLPWRLCANNDVIRHLNWKQPNFDYFLTTLEHSRNSISHTIRMCNWSSSVLVCFMSIFRRHCSLFCSTKLRCESTSSRLGHENIHSWNKFIGFAKMKSSQANKWCKCEWAYFWCECSWSCYSEFIPWKRSSDFIWLYLDDCFWNWVVVIWKNTDFFLINPRSTPGTCGKYLRIFSVGKSRFVITALRFFHDTQGRSGK